MNKLIGVESQSSQVARIIEKDILSGKLPPDSRLRSTRSMAGEFGVGQRVIVSALDILEQKDLVVRMPRKGVCVKTRGDRQNTKEILFFACGHHVESHPIIQAVMGLNHFAASPRNYDFFYRVISDMEGDERRLDTELARLDKLGYLDCAIFFLVGFRRKHVEKCLGLPYPVIFVGDPVEGDYGDLRYTRIGMDTSLLFVTAANYAESRSHRSVRLYIPHGIVGYTYIASALCALEVACRRGNIALDIVRVSGTAEREIAGDYKSLAMQKQVADPVDLMLTYGIHMPPEEHALTLAKLRCPERFDCLVLDSTQPLPGLKYVERDPGDLQDKLLREIENVCSPNRVDRKTTASFHYQIYSRKPLS